MKFLRGLGTVVGASVGILVAVGATVGACGGGETTASAGSSGSTTTASGTGGTAASSSGAGLGGGTTGTGESTSSATTGAGGTGGAPPTAKYDCSAAVGNVPGLKLTEVAMGIKRPVLVKGIPGDDTRLFVLGQDGKIWIIKDGALLPTPFLDISAIVHQPSAGDERGLLGMAFHPKYAQNGRFFLYYTDNMVSPGDQHLAEYKRSANSPDLADPTAVQVMFNEPDAESNHNGGALEFSPLDGYLYVGMGDGGGADDSGVTHGAFGNSQNLAKRFGKILRLDVDSATKPYGIPAGNITAVPVKDPNDPAMGNPSDPAKVNPEIWDFGLRNPWRFSFDLCTNDLYIGDVGQNKWEEVDVEPAGKGNKNYGWRLREGNHDFKPEGYSTAALVPPVAEYPHGPECSITGGYVYRGKAIPGLRGAYIYGDYCTGKIWTLSWANGVATVPVTHPEINPGSNLLVSFGQDNLGEIYVLALDGHVFRVDAQ